MDEWLSYQDAGDRLGISAEAVRQRAMRGLWPRRRSNEGTALVQIPEGVVVRRRTPVEQVDEHPPAPVREHPTEHPAERLVAALQAHIATLQGDVAITRSELAELRADYRRVVDELIELRKAPPPSPPPRRSPPRPRPVPTASEPPAATATETTSAGFISKVEFDTAEGMEAIRRRLEARLAERGH